MRKLTGTDGYFARVGDWLQELLSYSCFSRTDAPSAGTAYAADCLTLVRSKTWLTRSR